MHEKTSGLLTAKTRASMNAVSNQQSIFKSKSLCNFLNKENYHGWGLHQCHVSRFFHSVFFVLFFGFHPCVSCFVYTSCLCLFLDFSPVSLVNWSVTCSSCFLQSWQCSLGFILVCTLDLPQFAFICFVAQPYVTSMWFLDFSSTILKLALCTFTRLSWCPAFWCSIEKPNQTLYEMSTQFSFLVHTVTVWAVWFWAGMVQMITFT